MAPTKEYIAMVFAHVGHGDYNTFFEEYVVPNVVWTVQSKSILGGTYTSRDDFRSQTFGRLGKIMDPRYPVYPQVHNIVGGGPDEQWAVVEMTNQSRTKTGIEYNNTFAWATRWNAEGKIVQVRAYLDTALVRDAVEPTEKAMGVEGETPPRASPTSSPQAAPTSLWGTIFGSCVGQRKKTTQPYQEKKAQTESRLSAEKERVEEVQTEAHMSGEEEREEEVQIVARLSGEQPGLAL